MFDHASFTFRIAMCSALCFMPSCKESEETLSHLESLKKRTLEQLVFVEGGTFMMGDVGYVDENGVQRSFTNDPDTRPVHQVTLTSYSIQAYEVTFADFDFYTELMGEELVGKRYVGEEYRGTDHPADMMTWDHARTYCKWLGEQVGYPMDLPTEAQWEYAARSRGQALAYATSNGKKEVDINLARIFHKTRDGKAVNPLKLSRQTQLKERPCRDKTLPQLSEIFLTKTPQSGSEL